MNGRSRNRLGMASLALGGLLTLAAAGAAAAADDTQDILFFGGGAPILVRLHVEISGQPLSVASRQAVEKLHAYLDADGDGTLKREEAERVEWSRLRRFFGSNPPPAPAMAMAKGMTKASAPPALPALDARPPDGTVSVEELAEFLRALRAPFSIEMQLDAESDQDTTFSRIDANADGTLSAEEQAQGASVLRRFDQNDDATISSAELLTFRNPMFGFAGSSAAQFRSPEDVQASVLLLDPHGSRVRMVHEVLNRLDVSGPNGERGKDHRLSPTELGLAAEAFKPFDDDGDGTLDSDELMQFLDRGEPALELIVRLGPRPLQKQVVGFIEEALVANGKPGLGKPSKNHEIEVIDRQRPEAGDSPRVRISRAQAAALTLELGDVWVDVHVESRADRAGPERQIFNRQIEQMDANKDDILSQAEVGNREPFQSFFKFLDRNGDNQVSREERDAALNILEAVARGQSVLGVADRGVLLFANLDSSGDGRLGARELRAVGQRLAAFDRDGDGKLTSAEIPHRFEWSLAQAPMRFGINFRRFGNPQRMAPAAMANAGEGPAWFRSMDRNHDGDLSTREFLGPRAVFQKLDADGDGLVDAGEAKNARNP